MKNREIKIPDKRLRLCEPCCDNCPEVFRENGKVIITDDNQPGLVRRIELTEGQYAMLLKNGSQI